MFETSVVHDVVASKGRARLLTVSILAHTAVIVGVVGASIASVEFPRMAPDEYRNAPTFMPVQIPPPLGNPNGGAKPQPAPAQKPATPPQQPNQLTAPAVVPDEVIPADAPPSTALPGTGETGGAGTGEVEGPVGVPWGDPNSIGGDLDAPPAVAVPQPVEEKVYQPHEVKAPVLIRKVEPRYPPQMVRIGAPAVVVVRCVIDRNGNVRDAQVIRGALPPFNAAVIEAVQQWRFTPGSLRGQAVDSYLDLTVKFNVSR